MSAPHVFVSYDDGDLQAAEQIAAVLLRAGLPVWVDRWNLPPGQAWAAGSADALRSTDAVLALSGTRLSRRVETELLTAVSGTGYRPAVLHVALPGARRLYPVPSSVPPVDLSAISLSSTEGAAALLRAVFGALHPPGLARSTADRFEEQGSLTRK